MSGDIVHDVVVIGAGLAGLRSAQFLQQRGHSVCVIEARDRVGGRTTGTEYDNYQWDLGGQWVGPTQNRMYKLLEELGMKFFQQNTKGKKAYFKADGTAKTYSGEIPPASIAGLIDLQLTLWKFGALAKNLPVDKTVDLWTLPEARELDSITVENWCKQNMWTLEAKALINQGVRALLTVEATEVSLLYWIHFIRTASEPGKGNGMDYLIKTIGGAQQDRILGGSYTVSQKLAAKLKEKTIVFNQPVVAVRQSADMVEVKTESGRVFKGKYAIFACAPLMTSKVTFDPPLTTVRDELASRMPMGKVIKCLIFYKDNFWRKKGFSGELISENAIINMGFEATLQDDSHPSLVGFICGQHARYWSDRSQEERKKAVLEFYAKFFGEEALHPVHYMDLDWCRERFSRGGYTSVAPPGTMFSSGRALREPVGRIHWAGTETAHVWTAYMEGALESAERVTEEVDSRLKGKAWEPMSPPAEGSWNLRSDSGAQWTFQTYVIIFLIAVVAYLWVQLKI